MGCPLHAGQALAGHSLSVSRPILPLPSPPKHRGQEGTAAVRTPHLPTWLTTEAETKLPSGVSLFSGGRGSSLPHRPGRQACGREARPPEPTAPASRAQAEDLVGPQQLEGRPGRPSRLCPWKSSTQSPQGGPPPGATSKQAGRRVPLKGVAGTAPQAPCLGVTPTDPTVLPCPGHGRSAAQPCTLTLAL